MLSLFWPSLVCSAAVAILCAVLSPFVVFKRLSFVGQGISHAAFGGAGVAFLLGLTGLAATRAPGAQLAADAALFAVVSAFCILSALAIAWLSDRAGTKADTAIGIVLVASMALGFVLIRAASELAARSGRPSPPAIEAVLFGSVLTVDAGDMILAWTVTALTLAVLWWRRRAVVFWTFDEPSAAAFGVAGAGTKVLFLVLLAVAIVITMKLAGVILATALLVLPGAIAAAISDRFGRVLSLSLASSLVGVVGGLFLSFEVKGLQPAPAIVLALTVMYALARALAALRRR